MNERANKEYWNERVLDSKNDRDLVFNSVDFNRFDTETRKILSIYKDAKVLDFGCGYGRMSDMFTNYTGIDFSEEMIKLAKKKYHNKTFIVGDRVEGEYDLAFEVMCLSSLGMTAQEFADTCSSPVVMCFEPKEFTIIFK